MADIVTPNVKEASKLLGGVSLHTIADMRDAAESIYKFGPRFAFCILVTLFYFFVLKRIIPFLLSYLTPALSCACTDVHPVVNLHG